MKTGQLAILGSVILASGCNPSSPPIAGSVTPPVATSDPHRLMPMEAIPKDGGDVMLQTAEYPKGQTPDVLQVVHADPEIRNIRWVKHGKPNSYALRAFIRPRKTGSPIVAFTIREGLSDIPYRVLATYPARPPDHIQVLDMGRLREMSGTVVSQSSSIPIPAGLPFETIVTGGGLAIATSSKENHPGEFIAAWGPDAASLIKAHNINGSSCIPEGIAYGALYTRERVNGEVISDYIAKAYVDGPLTVSPERPTISKAQLSSTGWQTIAHLSYKSGNGKMPHLISCGPANNRFRIAKSDGGFLLQAIPSLLTQEPSFLITLGLGKQGNHNLWVDVEGRSNPDAILESP